MLLRAAPSVAVVVAALALLGFVVLCSFTGTIVCVRSASAGGCFDEGYELDWSTDLWLAIAFTLTLFASAGLAWARERRKASIAGVVGIIGATTAAIHAFDAHIGF